jgi:hypothetical protein
MVVVSEGEGKAGEQAATCILGPYWISLEGFRRIWVRMRRRGGEAPGTRNSELVGCGLSFALLSESGCREAIYAN